MEVTATEMQGRRVIHVSGRVDSSTAPQLQTRLAVLMQGGQSRVVVNLRDVDFLSSAGLRVLLSASRMARQGGGDVHLSDVSSQVARLLELTSFDVYFKCFASDSEAAGAF